MKVVDLKWIYTPKSQCQMDQYDKNRIKYDNEH